MKAIPPFTLPVKLNLLLASFCLICPLQAAAQAGLDSGYRANLTYPPHALAIQADGKLITGHATDTSTTFGNETKIFRFQSDGENDSSFDFKAGELSGLLYNSSQQVFYTSYITGLNSVSCFLDGTVAFSGFFSSVSRAGAAAVTVPKIFKSNEAGSLVKYAAPRTYFQFSNTGRSDYNAPYIASLSDNGALMFGGFNAMSAVLRSGIARLSSSGAYNDLFVPNFGLFFYIYGVAQQTDGKILIAGDFDELNGNDSRKFLVRLSSKGTLDTSFNPNPNDYCTVIALQADGKILVAGDFTTIGGGTRSYLARLNSNGTLDTSFDVDLNGYVYSIQTRVDGKILIAGNFTQVNNVNRGRYAVLNSDGSLAADYENLGASSSVFGSAIQNDGQIILGGIFVAIGTSSKNYLARLTPDVAAVNTLTTDADGTKIEWTRGGSAPEVENAEFRMRTTGTTFSAFLGRGIRTNTGWKLDKLKLPGNKNFDIQVKGLTRGGLWNASTSVMSSTLEDQFRPLPEITASILPDRTVVLGDATVAYSVTVTSAATVTYQWRLNGRVISGATASTYSIPAGVTAAQGGVYTCTVTSTAGSVTTNPGARLTVVTPITITRQPVFQSVLPGKSATFAVTVTGTSPQYQWYKGSLASPTPIGTNAPTFKIPVVSAADEDDYWVVITNSPNTVTSPVTSNLVRLYEVTDPAAVTAAPSNAIFALGATGSLTATTLSESPPINQWLRNNKAIRGATSIPLNFSSIELADAGKYTIRTSNPKGGETSATPAEVAVVDRLSTRHFVIAQNGTVSMTAIAAGNGLTYKWKKVGGADMVDTAPGVTPSVTGSSTKTLIIKGLQTSDTAEYTCEVTAPGGMLESAVQKVTVTTGPPVIASTLDFPDAMVNADYDYTVPVISGAEITPNRFTAKGLPRGLVIDSFTGRITGRPSLAKSIPIDYAVTITASNGSGPALVVGSDTLRVRPLTGNGALVGSFIGVITPSAPGTAFQSGGRIDLTTTIGGTYSGRLTLGTTSVSFKGGKLNVGVTPVGVDTNGRNTLTIPRRGLPALTLAFDLNIADLLLENGEVSDGTTTAVCSGWKQKWNSVDKALLYRGYYTMAMVAPAPAPGDLTYPLGDGYAAFTVADAGTLTVAGRLADGTTFTTSSGFVGPTGQIAVYNSLYGATGGYLWSDGVTITSLGAPPVGTAPGYLESTVSGSLKWTKRPQTSGYTYAAGFGPLDLSVIGARYAPTTVLNVNVLGLSVLTNDAQLTYTGANVDSEPDSPSIRAFLTDRNVFIVPTLASGENPAATAISLASKTGILTTSFVIVEDTDDGPGETLVRRTAKGLGVVVRNLGTGTGLGYGYFTLVQSPGSKTSEILSGRVRVTDATP